MMDKGNNNSQIPKSEELQNVLQNLPSEKREVLQTLLYPERVRSILESLSPEDRAVLIPAIYEESETESIFYGPLPPPEVLARYEALAPGSAKDMIDTYNQVNQAEIEIAKDKMKKGGRGQILGFALAVLFGFISFVSALLGHETFASIVGGGTVISLAAIFVLGQQPKVVDKK